MPSLGYIQKGPKIIPNEVSNGGGGRSALVDFVSGQGTDKSFNDLLEMVQSGIIPYVIDYYAESDTEYYYWVLPLYKLYNEEGTYSAVFFGDDRSVSFYSDNPDLPMIID